MAKLSSGAIEKSTEDLETKLSPFMGTLQVTTQPVVVCGVQRKINIGNYENIDVYAAVALPLIGDFDQDSLEELIRAKIDEAFKITSSETYERYEIIKEGNRNK